MIFLWEYHTKKIHQVGGVFWPDNYISTGGCQANFPKLDRDEIEKKN